MRLNSLLCRTWLAMAAGRSSRTGLIFVSSSSGATTTTSLRSLRRGLTLSCTAPGWMSELAASTVDRRLSTVCGYYRFAHIDGRIPSNPAQYVRRPRVHSGTQRGMDRGELASFLYEAERTSTMHAALAVLLGLNGLRVSEACGANIENLGFERGHRTLQIVGKGNKPAGIPLVPRTAERLTWRSGSAATDRSCSVTTAPASTREPPTAGSGRSGNKLGWIEFIRTCCALRSSWPRSTPASRCETCKSLPATPIPAQPQAMTDAGRTTTGTPPTPSSRSSPTADRLATAAEVRSLRPRWCAFHRSG